jgi:hypothetical protein
MKTIKKWRYVVHSKDVRIRRLLDVLSLEPIIIISIIANATLGSLQTLRNFSPLEKGEL